MELKKKVVAGFTWSSVERFGTLALQIIVLVVLARLLSPEEAGIVSMLSVFSVFATIIVDSGFTQALIYRQDITQRDYNSVFILSVSVSVLLYVLLVAATPLIVTMYERSGSKLPELTRIAPWVFAGIPLSALGCIQQTILTKQFRFRTLSGIGFTASLATGAVSIYLAYAGYSYWAFVAQPLVLYFVRSLLLWVFSAWRPTAEFSGESIKRLFAYGSRLFGASLIIQTFNTLQTVLIGQFYTKSQLGLYTKSLQLKDNISYALTNSVNSVAFPALSTLQDDNEKLIQASRKVIKVLSFVIFPVMAGLILTADDMFSVFLGEKWMGGTPYFRIFCTAGLFIPSLNICANIFKASGRSKLFLNLEIVKKCFAVAILIYAVHISTQAIAWAYLIWTAFEALLNKIYVAKTTGYRFGGQIMDMLPYILLTAGMSAIIALSFYFIGPLSPAISLVLKIVIGIASYTALSAAFKPEAWGETIGIIRNLYRKRSA